ncbi:amidohydrolase [Anaerovorax odorimutans]|uniref:Amidohydrolase n=1 Tax=Anaerovorax odorimutans TaxID=109327 RepID=A0ABT1RJ35_9FIRM|nr:amidohydrolase [Anaerovorax odorimutans]MCQ4635190.1 amidohydrolase [Anaerovorax odorimutans]
MNYDLILKNGNIITLNESEQRADWVAVKDGIISEVGLGKPPETAAAKETVDLKGATVLPGLFDAHAHVMPTGFFLNSVNLLESKSIDEVLKLLGDACREQNDDSWVFGAGFMSQNMKEERFPNKTELDRICNGHPIMIAAQTLHGISLNSKAMDRVDIPDVADVEKDEDGELKGVLLSDDAAFPVMGQIFAQLPEDRLFDFVKDCSNYAAAKGVTTMVGLMGQFVDGDKDIDLVIDRGDELPINIEVFYQTWDLEKIKPYHLNRIGGCLTLDGAGFEYTMALEEPYPEHPERRGFLLHTDEEIYQLVSKAHANNIQCAFHALGTRAIDQLIYIFKQVIGEQGPKDLRHRIEHFSLPTDKHMDMLAELGLIASMQPSFTGMWGQPEGGYYELLFGRERADRMEVFPEIIKRGGIICGGSDSPVSLVDPLYGIACCIKNPDPRRNVSVTEAIKIFTANAAYSVHLEDRKGTIEAGKDADFTVVDKDPYQYADSHEIYEMKPLMTINGGKIVYESK